MSDEPYIDLITGKPIEPWAEQAMRRRELSVVEQDAREALARITEQAAKREAGVQRDVEHRRRSAQTMTDADVELERRYALVPSIRLDDLQALIAALNQPRPGKEEDAREREDYATICDGKEQAAFEEWARSERFDMTEHPLHWLFLNAETAAARNGWKAGLTYAAERAKSAALLPAQDKQTDQVREAVERVRQAVSEWDAVPEGSATAKVEVFGERLRHEAIDLVAALSDQVREEGR